MSQPNPPARRKKSIVLDGAVASTILVVVVSLMTHSSSTVSLFALGWLVYGLYRLMIRLGKAATAIVVLCTVSLATLAFLQYQAGTPKRLLYAEIRKLGAYSIHTDGPSWAPEVRLVLFDKRVGDEEVLRFTQLTGLTHLRTLYFGGSRITDKALAGLAKLPQLQRIEFINTEVTQQGLDQLQTKLPDCEIAAEWADTEEPGATE